MRILIVDDHVDGSRALAVLFEMAGHRVARAETVARAHDACRRAKFDVLVVDHLLPDGDGCTLMRELRAAYGTPGVALTAAAGAADAARSRAAGFAAHVPKPVDISAALAAIGRAAGDVAPGSCRPPI